MSITINEAIKILDNFLSGDEPDDETDLPASIRLSIEALKRIKEGRIFHFSQGLIGISHLLPGETEK